jgi:hypothetical protein
LATTHTHTHTHTHTPWASLQGRRAPGFCRRTRDSLAALRATFELRALATSLGLTATHTRHHDIGSASLIDHSLHCVEMHTAQFTRHTHTTTDKYRARGAVAQSGRTGRGGTAGQGSSAAPCRCLAPTPDPVITGLVPSAAHALDTPPCTHTDRYMHTDACIHTYIHTYIHACIHPHLCDGGGEVVHVLAACRAVPPLGQARVNVRACTHTSDTYTITYTQLAPQVPHTEDSASACRGPEALTHTHTLPLTPPFNTPQVLHNTHIYIHAYTHTDAPALRALATASSGVRAQAWPWYMSSMASLSEVT